jgi:hypothetical protein
VLLGREKKRGDDPIWKVISAQVIRQSSTGSLGRSHLRPIKAEVADISFTSHKKIVFLLSRSRELLASLLPVSCHHHKRRRAGHGCRAGPPPPRRRPLPLLVHRRRNPFSPLPFAAHRLLNRSPPPPVPFPAPRRCCRVTFRATTRFFVCEKSALLQVGGEDGQASRPRPRGRQRGVPLGGCGLLRRHAG